jgi:hypothetical protein
MKKNLRVRINGQVWTISYGIPGKTNGIIDDGCCDYEKRKITINRKSESSFLNVLSHEVLHAMLPDFSEEAIEEIGSLIDDIYVKMQQVS